jgi:hypothetical protein
VVLLNISDPACSLAVLETLDGHPAVSSVPVLRLHLGLQGSDVVARIVLHPHHAARAAKITAELEERLLALPHILSATLASTIEDTARESSAAPGEAGSSAQGVDRKRESG